MSGFEEITDKDLDQIVREIKPVKSSRILAQYDLEKEKAVLDSVFRLTDTSNAEIICKLYGDSLRFDHRRKRWLVWSDHRWKPDTNGSVKRLAIEAARKRYLEAIDIKDYSEREKASRWSIQSENRQRILAAMDLAGSILPIADGGESWDQDKYLLSCPNGIIDLKTGTLRDGKPEDRITMATAVDYDTKAGCPRWELFIKEIFESDQEIIQYIHKALGYSITGDTSEQVAFFCFGKGANGKSVLFKTVRKILGDYGHDAPASLLQRSYNNSTNDVAATESKRFLVSSETLSTSKIDEQRLKAWTGGDRVSARYLYSEFFSFDPTVKPWLFINHKPQVDDDSYGFWRRVRLIPFNRVFTGKNEDKDLHNKLMEEAEGILNWLVKGCLLWQKEGLDPTPEKISEATQTYQSENDELYDFLADEYREEIVEEVRAIDIYRKYVDWATEQGLKQKDMLSKTALGRRMGGRFDKTRKSDGIYYKNVGLSTLPETKCIVNTPFTNTSYTKESIDSLRKSPPNTTLMPKKGKNLTLSNIDLSKDSLNELNRKKEMGEKVLKENKNNPTRTKAIKKRYKDVVDEIKRRQK